MANNDVQEIYRALEELNKRVDKLSKQKTLEKRVSTLEKDMEIVGLFLSQYVEPVLKVLTKLVPFKSNL